MLGIFLCAYFHPYLFFGKMSVQVSIFKNSVVCVVTNLRECLLHSEYKSFIRFLFFAKHFLPIMPCHLIFSMRNHWEREDGFNFGEVLLIPRLQTKIIKLFLLSFLWTYYSFRSVVLFEFIFVHSERCGLSFIFFSNRCLIIPLSWPRVWVYFWSLLCPTGLSVFPFVSSTLSQLL